MFTLAMFAILGQLESRRTLARVGTHRVTAVAIAAAVVYGTLVYV